MEIAAKYAPQQIEKKWYDYWVEHGFFHSVPDEREPYTVVIPPPNVTGVLHMGHMLNETIQDVLVRRARMQGKNACWVPGTDHASIATEAKVVDKLKSEGIDKNSLTREEFLKHAWEWKEKHGGIILSQLRRLGASCDWERTKFTMDPEMTLEIKGRNLVDGLPKNIVVHSEDVREALLECLVKITSAIKETLERTPPELSADIIDRGITLTGGGALLRGLDQLIQSETGIDVHIAEDPLDCVAKGAGAVLDHVDVLHDVLDTDGGHM